ncbi:MAG: SIMPL domain-containing protein [Chloroflexota bacterium]
MKNKFLFLFSILIVAVVLSACGPSSVQTSNPQIRSMFINGNGSTEITPDIAYVNIGVHTEASTAVTAVSMNNTQAQKVMDALIKFGIQSKDLRTSNFSIVSLQKTDPSTGNVTGTYYSVDNSIIVTVHDLPKMGSLLDNAIKAGANSINNVQFDVVDNTTALQQARDEAMQNAIKQAQELADAAGIQLGAIQTINYYESSPMYSSPTYMDYGKGGGGDMRAEFSVPVNPGQLTLTATVSITYALK